MHAPFFAREAPSQKYDPNLVPAESKIYIDALPIGTKIDF